MDRLMYKTGDGPISPAEGPALGETFSRLERQEAAHLLLLEELRRP